MDGDYRREVKAALSITALLGGGGGNREQPAVKAAGCLPPAGCGAGRVRQCPRYGLSSACSAASGHCGRPVEVPPVSMALTKAASAPCARNPAFSFSPTPSVESLDGGHRLAGRRSGRALLKCL